MTDNAMLQRLLSLEKLLTASIKGRDTTSCDLPSEGELQELKSVLDRLRPLLWIYLTRSDGRSMWRNSSAVAE